MTQQTSNTEQQQQQDEEETTKTDTVKDNQEGNLKELK